jgi:hypothetical protein
MDRYDFGSVLDCAAICRSTELILNMLKQHRKE